MTWSTTLLLIYCVLIAMSSLLGGYLPSLVKLTHSRMQFLVSSIGGLMLGVAIFHQLPHAVGAMSSHDHTFAIDWCVGWLMAGLLTTFFMLRMFHFHNHEPVASDDDRDHLCGHDHDHDHDAGHHHSHHPAQGAGWIGIFLGLSIHTLIDGAALAANVQADAAHGGSTAWLLGLGTFLGVVLHKPLDSLSITTLMAAGGWSSSARNVVNVGYGLMCPLGAVAFFFGIEQVGASHDVTLASALAFSAGVFLCISLSDLLPEVQFHSHDRMKLSFGLLAGVLLAYGIGFLEPPHTHGHQGEAVHQDGADSHQQGHKH